MDFEWDGNKNKINLFKHGITFEEAQAIFDGIVLTRVDDRRDYAEARYISIGRLDEDLIILVVYTVRGDITRLISARKANRREKEVYYERIETTFE